MKNERNKSAMSRAAILVSGIMALNLIVPSLFDWQQSTWAADSGWMTLFNGKDLSGWDGDPRLWSVEDGVIHGETTPEKPARGNTFLIWRGGKLKDFELRLKFRLKNGNGNSGVQYRSKEVDKWVVSGYQAEVENTPGKVGFLYHERGRGWLTNVGDFMVIDAQGNKDVVSKVSDVDELKKVGYYRDRDWNEYRIIAQGNHIVHYLNGYQTIELIDNDRVTNPDDPKDTKGAPTEGILALQIHAGPPMVVEFKDIRIKNLEPIYDDAVLLFDGKSLDDWQFQNPADKSKWEVGVAAISPKDPKMLVNKGGTGEMINMTTEHGGSVDIFSEKKFGDCRIELQVMVPQGSNSGIYVMGEYEIQVLDSWGRQKMTGGDMGAVYGASPPGVNASRKPGEWQRYVIDFRAPKFDAAGNKKTMAKLLTVELNDQLLHEDLTMKQQTPGGVAGKEAPTGPLMFQGNHGPVAYRNIVVKPVKE